MNEWSDVKKWSMDLVKTTLGAFLGIALTVLVVGHYEEKRRQEASASAIRVSAIQEFSKAATIYGFGAYDAARDQLRGVVPDESAAIRKWHTEEYRNLELAKLSVKQAFPQVDPGPLIAFAEGEQKVFTAVNAAPLFPLGKLPTQCDDEKGVNDAWKNQGPPQERTLFETREMWLNFKNQCFGPVLKSYDQAVEAVVSHLRTRPAH